jgi:hypothetical protein
MTEQNFQTIRLSAGRHAGPEHGACVVELASMLAGESFSDHPRSVCPVIGAFLRSYNDGAGDDRRQRLYAHASRIVGSASTRAVQRERGRLLRAWAHERGSRLRPNARVVRPIVAAREAAMVAIASPGIDADRDVLALLDDLLAVGTALDAGRIPDAGPGRPEPVSAAGALRA